LKHLKNRKGLGYIPGVDNASATRFAMLGGCGALLWEAAKTMTDYQ
jgi:hypothetical protein